MRIVFYCEHVEMVEGQAGAGVQVIARLTKFQAMMLAGEINGELEKDLAELITRVKLAEVEVGVELQQS